MDNDNREYVEVNATILLRIDPFWIEYCTQYNDLFMTSHSGYWMRGVERDNELGWLVYEIADEDIPFDKEPNNVEARQLWRAGKELPPGYFRLDKKMAIQAWLEGVRRYGEDWYENTDALRDDVVIQLAMLGEVRYG